MSRILVIATRNPDKLREIAHLFQAFSIDVRGLAEFSHVSPVLEDRPTIFENAMKKAIEVAQQVEHWVLADDTGLFVDALDGAPGVMSARYSGLDATYESNMRKLLSELEGVPKMKRSAVFRTVIALRTEKSLHLVEGELHGRITSLPRGEYGFGYDPVFELSDGRT
ncbi:non-canonical purine NTP pyrophosphatase, partial [bacterium]|nr:non-canonical purine NTP pyrophosphatase [bacterium]